MMVSAINTAAPIPSTTGFESLEMPVVATPELEGNYSCCIWTCIAPVVVATPELERNYSTDLS